MAKAINWPQAFREDVLGEDTETLRCAIRPGDLYYVNRYWVPEEEVDIRVNHKKIRKARVVGDLKFCMLSELSEADHAALKPALRSLEALTAYLDESYTASAPHTASTGVTVVYYRNLPIVPEDVEAADDPHL